MYKRQPYVSYSIGLKYMESSKASIIASFEVVAASLFAVSYTHLDVYKRQVLGKIPDEQFVRIVRTHGADKILFATDSPWAGQKEFIELLSGMPLTEEEKDQIFYKNACSLLAI